MCGIYGFDFTPNANISKARKATLITALTIANEDRGGQSWGAYLPEHGDDGLMKRVGSITDERSGLDVGHLVRARIAMAHTRYATRGANTEANAHPFVLGDGWVGQHNGVVGNYGDLDKRYGEEPVDSIHLLKAVAGTNPIPLSEINVYGSVQLVPESRDRIYLGRMNGGQLCIVELPRIGIVFTSDEDHMKVALRLAGLSDRAIYLKVDEGVLYVTYNGEIFVHDQNGLKVGSYNRVSYGTWQSVGGAATASKPASSYTVPRSSVYGGYDRSDEWGEAWWQGELRTRESGVVPDTASDLDDDVIVIPESDNETIDEAWQMFAEYAGLDVNTASEQDLLDIDDAFTRMFRRLDVLEAFALQENDVMLHGDAEDVREHLLQCHQEVTEALEAVEWKRGLATIVPLTTVR